MVQTCQKKNVHVVNTDKCWNLHECLWIAWESRPINVHSISQKKIQNMPAETRKTQVSMFLIRYIKVAINFAGMLLVDVWAYKWQFKIQFRPFFETILVSMLSIDALVIYSWKTYVEKIISTPA